MLSCPSISLESLFSLIRDHFPFVVFNLDIHSRFNEYGNSNSEGLTPEKLSKKQRAEFFSSRGDVDTSTIHELTRGYGDSLEQQS